MPEGLSAHEVGKEIAEHAESKGKDHAQERRDRLVSIAEAVLLSIVALMAAWSGYAAAKWSTESRVGLAAASTARTKASRANLQAIDLRNFDSSTFEAWFSAYTAHNKQAMALAEHRFRPAFRVAFDAWRATKPESNPNAPRGPTYMPQYRQPDWEGEGARHSRQMRPSPQARARARPPTNTYVPPSSSRACSFWSASARNSLDVAGATRLLGLALCSWSSPSCSSRSCRARPREREAGARFEKGPQRFRPAPSP